ncbi:MAG: hypothetical protein E7547_07940 [Ruminococcaceae bacterium]|nr:hypothetical protein [Oscillospiraceae bacterium]
MSKKKNQKKSASKKAPAKKNIPVKGIVIAAVAVLLAVAVVVAVVLIKKNNDGNTDNPSTHEIETLPNEGTQYTYAKYKTTKLPVEFVEILNQAEIDSKAACEKYGVALEIGDRKISVPEFVFNYYDMYSLQTQSVQYSIEQTGQNRTGYDTEKLPGEQNPPQKDYTWEESFTLDAIDSLKIIYSLFDMAVEAGTEIDVISIASVIEECEVVEEKSQREGITPEESLANVYCEGLTPAMYKARAIMETYAQAYENEKFYELRDGYSQSEIEKAFNEDVDAYKVLRARVYPIEGEYNEAEAKSVKNEKEFLEYARKNYPTDGYDAEFTTDCGFITKEKLSSVYGEEVGTWAFDSSRKKGDIAVIEGMFFRYLVYIDTPAFLSTSCNVITLEYAYDDSMAADDRANLFKDAEKAYTDWKNNDGTEKGFLDYSTNNGGMGQATVRTGEYFFEIDNWIFAPERKAGDSAIIDTPYGYCAVYYSGKNADDFDWRLTVSANKASADLDEFYNDLWDSDYKIERKSSMLEKAYTEADKSIKRHWARLEEQQKDK